MNNHDFLLASHNRGQVGVNAGEVSVLLGFSPPFTTECHLSPRTRGKSTAEGFTLDRSRKKKKTEKEMQEKTVYHYDFFFPSPRFVQWRVQFQISSLKVTACLFTSGLKTKSLLKPFLRTCYRERLLSMKGKFKISPGQGSGIVGVPP